MKKGFLLIALTVLLGKCFAQDQFVGSWQLNAPLDSSLSIKMNLQIGESEKRILYPACLTLECDSFKATYHLLLVKKNIRQLGISRYKKPISEIPFSIGNWTIYLNGVFDISKDLRGNSFLTINRIITKDYSVPMPTKESFDSVHLKNALHIQSFLKDSAIQLKQYNQVAWKDSAATDIIRAQYGANYFGIIEPIRLRTKEGAIAFNENKDNDIVSVFLNGKNIVDQVDSKKKRPKEEFLLDSGLNIIAFFAEDYGSKSVSGASINLEFDNKIRPLDFKTINNLAGTFIVAKIYCDYQEEHPTFQSYNENESASNSVRNGNDNDPPDNKLSRTQKNIGGIVSTSQYITLAVWDDAVEDGDTISININGKWITQGFPVLKKPQFIKVSLEPGPNTITFVADNLGSIVPNTSVIEIIDGDKRKAFYIETDLGQNNLIKIFYDFNPHLR
jgi:hypothetical protein